MHIGGVMVNEFQKLKSCFLKFLIGVAALQKSGCRFGSLMSNSHKENLP